MISSSTLKQLFVVTATLVLFGLLLFGYGIVTFDTPPVDMQKFTMIAVGMRKDEVVELLGTPDNQHDYDTLWEFSRPFSWPVVLISFDDEGKCIDKHYDY
ncbi:hypothetical protein AB1L42_20660 [Thalassoglobus sp. JC818]|uniref:hypothetical protein n=1 Tax=Thalassoglobus sp. JC818 TaxID=3232136 RepID=UPI00345A8059